MGTLLYTGPELERSPNAHLLGSLMGTLMYACPELDTYVGLPYQTTSFLNYTTFVWRFNV